MPPCKNVAQRYVFRSVKPTPNTSAALPNIINAPGSTSETSFCSRYISKRFTAHNMTFFSSPWYAPHPTNDVALRSSVSMIRRSITSLLAVSYTHLTLPTNSLV